MTLPNWRALPCIYEASLNGPKMLSEQRPFETAFVDLFASAPAPLHWHAQPS